MHNYTEALDNLAEYTAKNGPYDGKTLTLDWEYPTTLFIDVNGYKGRYVPDDNDVNIVVWEDGRV